MNWISLAIPLITGLLGGMVGGLVSRGRDGRSRAVILAVCFAVAAVLGHLFVAPRAASWQESRSAEKSLLDVEVYRVLKQHEPDSYAKILAEYRRARADGKRLGEFTAVVMNDVSAVTSRRLSSASQDSLLALMRDMLGNLRRLSTHEDACFRYLFPNVAGPADVGNLFDEAAQERSLALLANVIRSSAENPVTAPSTAEAQQKLAPVLRELYAEFGEDTQLLAQVGVPGVDRQKVCAVTIALYDKVLRLPPDEAAMVLRLMVAAA
jgi:hypothetical protein